MGLRLSGFLLMIPFLVPASVLAAQGEVIDIPPGKNPPLLIGYGMQMMDKAMADLSKLASELQFDLKTNGFMRVGSKESGTPNQPIILISRDRKVIDAIRGGRRLQQRDCSPRSARSDAALAAQAPGLREGRRA